MPSALQIKVIKPARFKDEAFKAAIQAAAKEVADEMVLDFRETTRPWKHKVKFEEVIAVDPNVEILVGTDDEVFGFVNNGTKPHAIFPRKAKALAFQWGGKGSYRPKTKPKVIGSTPGGPSGPKVALPYVQHPGTDAREFDVTIEKKWKPRFKRLMEAAMSEAAKASGHGIP
jgi:hypothetical protein